MSKVRRSLNEARVSVDLTESERLLHPCMVDGRQKSAYPRVFE